MLEAVVIGVPVSFRHSGIQAFREFSFRIMAPKSLHTIRACHVCMPCVQVVRPTLNLQLAADAVASQLDVKSGALVLAVRLTLLSHCLSTGLLTWCEFVFRLSHGHKPLSCIAPMCA